MTAADDDALPSSPRPARARLGDAVAVVMGLGDARAVEAGARSLAWPSSTGERSLEAYAAWLLARWPRNVRNGLAAPITDPRHAWEALASAGLLGDDDVDCAARRFDDPVVQAVTITRSHDVARRELVLDGVARTVSGWEARGEWSWPDAARRAVPFAEDRLIERERNRLSRELRDALDARPRLAHPPTIADAVALAADWPVVLRAEALMRAIAAASGAVPPRVVWRTLDARTDGELRDAFVLRARSSAMHADLLETGYVGAVELDAIWMLAPPLGP